MKALDTIDKEILKKLQNSAERSFGRSIPYNACRFRKNRKA